MIVRPLFSPEDSDLGLIKWYETHANENHAYAVKRATFAHRIVLSRMLGRELTSNDFCDHINGAPLDNRRENLRLVTRSENLRNRNHWRGCRGTPFTGIALRGKRWHAQIQFREDGRKLVVTHESSFATPEEAALAYNQLAERFGFRTRNVISTEQTPKQSTARPIRSRR